MAMLDDPKVIVQRLFDLYGGRDAAFAALDRQHRAIAEHWDQDAPTMGRILRAHLFVEHYLTQYLQTRNPNLNDIDEARLSFGQKLALIAGAENCISYLIPGIRRLNKVRNRVSHTLRAEVTLEDGQVLLSIDLFRELRKALASPGATNDDPIAVLEDFAKHAGIMLEAASNPDFQKWAEAIRGNPKIPT